MNGIKYPYLLMQTFIKKLGWTELRYPSIFNKDEIDYILYDPEISYTYTGKEVVVSLGQYDSIFVSSDFKHKKRIMLKAIICPTCVQSPKIYKLIYSKPYMTEDCSPITTT